MINTKIKELLEDIAPVFYKKTTQKLDKYIIFRLYDEQDEDFYDNQNDAEAYYITLTYWCTNSNDLILYKKIKQKLKSNGFSMTGCADQEDGNLNGKNMDFFYIEE